MAYVDGKVVAGLHAKQDPQQPVAWTTYLAVDDLDHTIAEAEEAGGHIVVPARDVMELGRFAVIVDNTGGVFGLWQAKEHHGADLVDEVGAMCWNELLTHSYLTAQTFYSMVVEWVYEEVGYGGAFVYSHAKRLDGQVVAGFHQFGPDVPFTAPSFWQVWFRVADADATAAKVAELGGSVLNPPSDSRYGRMATVTGPAGERFGIIAPVPPAQ